MSETTNKPAEPQQGPAAENAQPELSEAEKKKARRAKARKRHLRSLRDMLVRLFLLVLVVYILVFHLVGITVMPNGDMYPRVDMGDLVLFYRLEHNIRAQDIIVFEKPTASLELSYEEGEEVEAAPRETAEKPWWRKALNWLGFRDPDEPPTTMFICRVVAGPGDTVEISEGEHLIVNGNSMIETNIYYSTPEYAGFVEYPLQLGEGEYFVLADYRNGGADSRFFGAVQEEDILGTVITIVRRNNL